MTLTYLLPLRRDRTAERADGDLARYLGALSDRVDDLVIVDGSPPPVFEQHAALFAGFATHIAPEAQDRCANGKAWAVLTGLRHARHDAVVIADDDVRWEPAELWRAVAALQTADVVVVTNFFTPMVWHAAWDTGRILLNRAIDHDWPGTLVVRCAALSADPRYDGNVLFENCELLRTVAAGGGTVHVAHDLLVARRPPTLRHFLAQRPRQAYDDLAQPVRLAAMLAVVPAAALGGRRAIAVAALLSMLTAEAGRRRAGGRRVFPWYTSLFAPAWVLERGVLAWWTVWLRGSGRGVAYSGHRLLHAATPMAQLRARRRPQAAPGRSRAARMAVTS